MKKPELLAPGGSFAAAFQAFEAGADGVYLGLAEFSARKAAVNFSPEQLRRIRELARQRGRRIYVTLNTVIKEEEMSRAASVCAWLDALEVDGVIVQDFGLLSLLARSFPRLPIHASTQMAIHNDAGLRFAEKAGIRRVILSRELPLESIKALRARHPGIELEVFIHGALCYSFSGVCLASWALTGRSGNRGECAQICRSVFCSGQNTESSPFSCRDLALGTEVLKLAEAGIDSLKIEGRMKSPEYVFHVTRLYREILDKGSALSPAELAELQRNAEATFSREKTSAYFHSPRGRSLLTAGYPGHRGIPLGAVSEMCGREMGLRLLERLSLHDGIGFWQPAAVEPSIFAVKAIQRGGRLVRYAEAGEEVFVMVAREAPLPSAGTEVRLFSSRFLDRPQPKETSVPLFKVPFCLTATLAHGEEAGTMTCSASGHLGTFTISAPLTLLDSTGGKSFEAVVRKLFEGSAGSLAGLVELSFVNDTGRKDTEIFVPPSELKKVKNDVMAALDVWLLSAIERKAQTATSSEAAVPAAQPRPARLAALSDRNLLSPPSVPRTPFASLEDVRRGPQAFSSLAGFVFVPLPPVMLEEGQWAESLQRLCAEHPAVRFALGLNNAGHVQMAEQLAGIDNCFFFIDYFLYVANRGALSFLAARLDRLLFLYSWIEGDAETFTTLEAAAAERQGAAVLKVAEDHRPALFFSLGCFERHALGGGRCREGCPKDFAYELRQGKNLFDVVVKDCVTYLFQTSKESNHAGKLRADPHHDRRP
jgi:putative protease